MKVINFCLQARHLELGCGEPLLARFELLKRFGKSQVCRECVLYPRLIVCLPLQVVLPQRGDVPFELFEPTTHLQLISILGLLDPSDQLRKVVAQRCANHWDTAQELQLCIHVFVQLGVLPRTADEINLENAVCRHRSPHLYAH